MEEIHTNNSENVPIVLVATKCDLAKNRQVTEEEGKAIASSLCLHYFETSSLTNLNINETFMFLVEEVMKRNHEK